MFCYQCEQTQRTETGLGCGSTKGTCGKEATTSDLQDLLIHAVKGLAQYEARARALGKPDRPADHFILAGLFATLTNVNFNNTRLAELVAEAARLRDRLRAVVGETLDGPAAWRPAPDMAGLLEQAATVPVNAGIEAVGPDVVSLRTIVLYGMKGVVAYAHHARLLGYESDEIYAETEAILAFLAADPCDADALTAKALEVGTLNLKVMDLLDRAHKNSFGTPRPTPVRVSPVKGKALLVSGHDLADLKALLDQTKDMGINIYTHGEMLPAHAYPALKAYPHLVGNYGSAWPNQQREFAEFPGPILMTSNCIIEPNPRYRQRIFTAGPVAWPGVRHIEDHAFAPLIEAAKALPGFKEDAPEETITVGFGADAVLSVADKVIDAVKAGAIRHFFLIGGCDGAAPGRSYFTDFATGAPQDTVVLTLGCGKYRFNRHDFGDIGGIPRLLDLGQCNDAHSAIKIASALAGAFGCGVNDLPLSLIISWFEQKAVAVLLSLFALGIRNIRLGPTLPAFITPNVLAKLVDSFAIKPATTVEADMADALKIAV